MARPTSINLQYTGMLRQLPRSRWMKLIETVEEIRYVPAREVLVRRGEQVDESLLVVEGLMGRYIPIEHTERAQMVALQIPGDFVDLHGFPLGVLDHDIQTVSPVTLAAFPHAGLHHVVQTDPDLGIDLWALTLIDAATHRHWAFRMGSMRATMRVANFICEMHYRLSLCERASPNSFDLPVSQIDLADACGMTPVHLSRVLRDLREEGCCTFREGQMPICDMVRLNQLGAFNPAFLNLNRHGTSAQKGPA